MHILKDKILLCALVAVIPFLFACAGTTKTESSAENKETAKKGASYKMQQEEKLAMLEETFSALLNTIRTTDNPSDLLPFITDTSEYWLDTLEYAALQETAEDLNKRSFAEVYAIVRYRIYEREHMWGSVTDDKMLSLMLAKQGILDRLTALDLGPMKIKEDRGSVGLASSPEVPVILFVWDDVKWELDLKASMPLVTKGIESIGVKKSWSNTKLALYLLEKEFRFEFSRIDDTLLDPSTAF